MLTDETVEIAMEQSTLSLHQAFTEGNSGQIRDVLLNNDNRSLSINQRDEARGLQTVLMRLCHLHMSQSERSEILQLILEKNPDINFTDSSGRTALTHACIAEKTDVVRSLAALPGCDPNIVDEDGNTALIYAVKSRRADIVQAFLQCFQGRVDVNIVNNKGICALTEAQSRLDGDICRLLIREGHADVAALDHVKMSRDTRTRAPRSPVPEAVPMCGSPLSPRHNRKRNKAKSGDVLSPLVTSRAPPLPYHHSNVAHVASHAVPDQSGSDTEMINPLSDVQEEEEGIESDVMYEEPGRLHSRDRRNSLSMPDLRETSLIASTPSSGTGASYAEDPFPKLDGRLERRRTQNTFVEETALSQVSEEDESGSTTTSCQSSFSDHARRRRRGSLSLPDLRDCGKGLVARPVDSGEDDEDDDNDDGNNAFTDKQSQVTYQPLTGRHPAERHAAKPRLPQLNIGLDLDLAHRGSHMGFSPSGSPRHVAKRRIGLGLTTQTQGTRKGVVVSQTRKQDSSPRLALTGEQISRGNGGKR